jgi:hypothetical protein
MAIREEMYEIPSKRIELDNASSDSELMAWSKCSEETKRKIFSFHLIDDLDLSPIDTHALQASQSFWM